MSKQFTFQPLSSASNGGTEANIFIHGYSAGHNREDRQTLLESIPEAIRHYTNIFAFWPSSHFSRLNGTSRGLIGASTRLHWAAAPVTLMADRAVHFVRIRSRAENMGEALLDQLNEYLRSHHPEIDSINLIGHSLGGRVVVSSLKTLANAPSQRLAVNDVLLMAAAAEVTPDEAQRMRSLIKGRLINAYSKADWTLLIPLDEACLGRNEVEHFENIQIAEFGHSDYWKKLPEVLASTQFKSPSKNPQPLEEALATTRQAPLPTQSFEDQTMTLDLETPGDIYQRINDELAHIVRSLNAQSNDAALNQAQNDARTLLAQYQTELQMQLTALEKNAEWNTFTIAFYGETGAGKSTIIETLRILLQERSKLANQQAFRELRGRYGLSEEKLQQLQQAIKQTITRLDELTHQLSATLQRYEQPYRAALEAIDQADIHLGELTQRLGTLLQQHEQLHDDALGAVTRLQALIGERKRTASLWQKLLNLFRKMPEEIKLGHAEEKLSEATAARDSIGTALTAEQSLATQSKIALERQLAEIAAASDNAITPLLSQQAEAEQNKFILAQQRQEIEAQLVEVLAELEKRADGEIIGDGRADFTRQTQRYDLELDGQPFALLDVPGIEGNEGLIRSEIEQAVQTAHAVFYVTNQAAPPQTGDDQRKGTLEKIKAHLGAQTEVWTIFNKKITNPKHSLTGRPLTSDDENASLAGLDEKMREQLGKHYREVFPLTALPAFLASTDHFAPNSQNATRRNKILADFSPEVLLEKSRFRSFLQLLGGQLLSDSKAKITRANFNKANEALNQATETLGGVQRNFAELSEKLKQDGHSTKTQLSSSFKALKQRLESCGETLIDSFASHVRNKMYALIEDDISNDYFKDTLRDKIESQQKQLSKQLPEAMGKEIERFQQDAEDILKRFAEQAHELSDIYAKLNSTQLNGKFNFKLDIDNGIKIGSLLLTVGGTIAAILGTGGWILAVGLAGLIFSFAKAVWSFFDSDYKKSQQRKSTDDNLRSITEQLRESLRNGLRDALPDMQQKISLLEKAIEAPFKQTTALVQALNQSANKLKALSRQIDNAGNL